MPATQRDARVRVEYRDAYRNRVQIYVSPKEAKVLHDTHAASYKPRSEREMNLRAGLSITRDNFGLIELDEVRFLSQDPRPVLERIYERCLQLKLNCASWARRAPCRDPYIPLKLILSV